MTVDVFGEPSEFAALTTVVRASRRFLVGTALGCAFIAWIFIGESVLHDAGATSLAIGVFAAAGCVASSWRAIKLPVVFSIHERGLELGRGKRFVRWDDVEDIRISHHNSGHSLILKLKPTGGAGPRKFITTNATNPDELELGLDHMSLGWQRVVSDVEAASGLKAHAFREQPFGQRSRPIAPDRNS